MGMGVSHGCQSSVSALAPTPAQKSQQAGLHMASTLAAFEKTCRAASRYEPVAPVSAGCMIMAMAMMSKMMRLAILVTITVAVAHAFDAGHTQTRRATPPITCADESSGQADHPLLAIALAGVLSSTCAAQPAGAVERDALKGKEVFAANCSGCHAGGTNSIAVSKTLRREALQKYVSASLDADEVCETACIQVM